MVRMVCIFTNMDIQKTVVFSGRCICRSLGFQVQVERNGLRYEPIIMLGTICANADCWTVGKIDMMDSH